MSVALEAISRSEKTGDAMRQLQHWLHIPSPDVGREEIAAVITPYAVEASKPEAPERT